MNFVSSTSAIQLGRDVMETVPDKNSSSLPLPYHRGQCFGYVAHDTSAP